MKTPARYLYIGSDPDLQQEALGMFDWSNRTDQIAIADDAIKAMSLAKSLRPQAVIIGSEDQNPWGLDLIQDLKDLLPESDILVYFPPEVA